MSSRQRRVRRDWAAVVEAQRGSGLSVRAFCRQEHINVSLFYHHRQQCRRAAALAPAGFVELRPVAGPATAAGVTVLVAGWRVEVAPDFDPPTLQRVCACLGRGQTCLP